MKKHGTYEGPFPIFTKLFVPNKGHVNFKTQKKCLVCHGEKLRHYVEVHQ